MALSFPASPSVNDTFTSGARTWTWSGTIWEITGSIAAAGSVGPAELAANAVTSAKLATSISLTGTPLAPTPSAGTNTTQIATTAFVTEAIPVGVINPYAGSSAPSGWLLCYGQSTGILRSTYSALFAVIGTTYGAGDGTTTFNLPDLRGRAVAGIDNMGGTDAGRLDIANSSGTVVGSQYVTLTSAEMPSHTHVQDSHSHEIHRTNQASASMSQDNASGHYKLQNGTGATMVVTQGTVAVNQNTGGGGAHNNMQPTMVLNYIIKAL